MTYEPQTTVKEQDQTIEDLKRTKPEVIIFDPLQAHGLSGSLWKISDYIIENYRIQKVVMKREILWIMVPKKVTTPGDKLVYQLYHDNYNKTDANGVENAQMHLSNAIMQNSTATKYFIDTAGESVLRTSVADIDGLSTCGFIKVRYQDATNKETTTQLCAYNHEVQVPIRANQKRVQITLEKQGTAPIIWNDVSVIGN